MSELRSRRPVDLELVWAYFRGDESEETKAARRTLRKQNRDLHDAIDDAVAGDNDAARLAGQLAAEYSAGLSMLSLHEALSDQLVALGVIDWPDPSLSIKHGRGQQSADGKILSTGIPIPPSLEAGPGLPELLDRDIQAALLREIALNVFAGNGRDLESLGLAVAQLPRNQTKPPDGLDEASFTEVLRSTVRILGDSRRLQDMKGPRSDGPPKAVKQHLTAAAMALGVDVDVLIASVSDAIA